ncbi:SDR family NAD(P)-dependent oxidoreductase [Phormidium tenue FACHB-886]|nr:SDR family NAD(P)-dependent oxidoreductase [Phormidium tenue FACHB-886]
MTTKRVVLITGANKGIGYEVARQLASNGLTVLLESGDSQRGTAAKILRAENSAVYYVLLTLQMNSLSNLLPNWLLNVGEKSMYWRIMQVLTTSFHLGLTPPC